MAANDARNAAFMHMGGDKKAMGKAISKWANIAKNPAQSMLKTFKGIFGFGVIVPYKKCKSKPKPRTRPKRKK